MENQIELRSISELLGLNFYIPNYQRGYRWTETNVTQLLEDIWDYRSEKSNANQFYCLQPIVVRKAEWQDQQGNSITGYELIDGQQRLTTIHRIITYFMIELLGESSLQKDYNNDLYGIYYQTRPESKSFLEKDEYTDEKPDLYYMSEAYNTIKSWFDEGERPFSRAEKNRFLDSILPEVVENIGGLKQDLPEWSVQVIWYEINDQNQKSEELFTRLNRGKIPLTSAELIKAKFVNEASFKTFSHDEKLKRRTQLIQIWDEIENQLNNGKLWGFISNEPIEKYSNKIEYLFDIITQKRKTEKDKLYSFIKFFDHQETADSLWKKWLEVEEIYRALVFWFSDKNMYHKIGYLIATGTQIGSLISLKKENNKRTFENEIDKLISNKIPKDWDQLSYNNSKDHNKISDILLLVNIELIRSNKNANDYFPFSIYKSIKKSIEHIHAQNIEDIDKNKQSQWINWLDAHFNVLPNIVSKESYENLEVEYRALGEEIKYVDFERIAGKILKLIPKEAGVKETDYLHKIENLALLGLKENISLSNSIFEVKREKIIEKDKEGAFIPIATKRVFLKYYSEGKNQHYSVWTNEERSTYLTEINQALETYNK